MGKLSDKVAVVTGRVQRHRRWDSNGLGRCGGARSRELFLRPRESSERIAKVIIDNGSGAIAVEADVSKAADVARLFKEADSAFGKLDILVNNAGVFRFGAFTDITEQSFHVHYNINVL